MNLYPRTSVEYLAVQVTVDDVATTDAIQIAVTKAYPVDADWHNTEVVDNKNVYLQDMSLLWEVGDVMTGPQTFNVWTRVTDTPEIPVMKSGTITVF
jgi:hypothetical protein